MYGRSVDKGLWVLLINNIKYMIKKTFKELLEIDEVHGKLLQQEGFENTKLGYSLKRFSDKNIKKIFTDFNDVKQNIRIDNALVDEKTGALLYHTDGQSFKFTKEGLKRVISSIREATDVWDSKEFDVEPMICTELTGIELTGEDREILKDVVI